jgi:hypothetical protein
MTWILIIFLSTSTSHHSGAAALSQEFHSEEKCIAAGTALTVATAKDGSHVIAWGCYRK